MNYSTIYFDLQEANLTDDFFPIDLPIKVNLSKSNKEIEELFAILNEEKDFFSWHHKEEEALLTIDMEATKSRLDEVKNQQGYQLNMKKESILLKSYGIRGLYYGLITLKNLVLSKGKKLPEGVITDYPTLLERRFHLDMGRKYFTKEWIVEEIHKMSRLKFNTFQMHFAENLGFRIECSQFPEIVSKDGFLTKEEVREIIQEANRYQIDIIPSLDTPGHVAHILKSYPEFGQLNNQGVHSKTALDITNQKAIDFMKKLYGEYIELFETSSIFHIGGDEYMEFDRPPFTTEYQEVLEAYAKRNFGDDYTWKDVVADYINQMANFVHEKGFTPRIWNDGIFYGENDETIVKQKVEMVPYLQVDFWCQMGWNPAIATLDNILNRQLKEIYNVNSNFFYYVLRSEMPEDGRLQHSFDVENQDRNIFENWHPGVFSDHIVPDDAPYIKGAALAVWCDLPDLVDEEVIAKDIANEMETFGVKTWNPKISEKLTYEKYHGAFI